MEKERDTLGESQGHMSQWILKMLRLAGAQGQKGVRRHRSGEGMGTSDEGKWGTSRGKGIVCS